MKIAVCFFGFPREVEICYLNLFNHIIRGHEQVDIYAHLWWDDSLSGELHHKKSYHVKKELINKTYKENEDQIFKDIYLPKSIQIEKPMNLEDFDFSLYEKAKKSESPNPLPEFGIFGTSLEAVKYLGGKYRPNRVFFSEYSQWKSKKNSLKLAVESKEKYDLYVLTRTDLITKDRIEYDELEKETLYCSNGIVFGGTGGFLGSDYPFSDLFACGNLKNMSSYTEFFDSIYDYIELPIHLQLEKHLSINNKIKCEVKKVTALPYYLFKDLNSTWPKYEFPIGRKNFKFPRKPEERRSNKTRKGFKGDNKF